MSSTAQTVTVTNGGTASLTVTGVTLSGDFAQTNNSCGTVAVGGSCQLGVEFTPTLLGARTGVLTLTSNAASSPQTVALSGTGGAFAISLSPAMLSFATQPLNTLSAAQTVSVMNSGAVAVSISGVALSGDFVAGSNTCGTGLAAGATCQIGVVFTPTAVGARAGLLTFTSNGSLPNAQTVALSGTGAPTALSFSPGSLSFGTLGLNTPSAAQAVTVSNGGTAAVTIAGATVSGDFSVGSNGCGASLAAGATCQIGVVFTPTAVGARAGLLTFTSNGSLPNAQTVALSGTGAPTALSFSPGSLSFGTLGLNTPSAAQAVTVSNGGTAAVTIAGATVSGDFSVGSNGCGASLAAGATCQIGVVFTPTVVGARVGSLTVLSNSTASPQTVALSGTGGTSAASVSTLALSFPAVAVSSASGAQTVLVSSTGTAPLNLTGITLSGDFQRASTTCSATLAAGSTCQIAIDFAPGATGLRTGALTVASNAAGGAQVVSLSGTGTSAVPLAGSSFQVAVRAGTQPIRGATVQLYAAGTTGNGSAGSALLANALTTDATGAATVAAGFSCPSATAPLYLVSTGGMVGSAGPANGNIKLLTALGRCSGVSAGTTYTVNEATTVAAAYALAQFYGSPGTLGATGTNLTGLTNAFATAATLADPLAGTSPGSTLPANAVSPAARVNAVANMVNACVISAPACAAFYSATTATTLPSNTLDAVFGLALHPGSNVATLYGQSLLSTAYAPALQGAPADWTMFVTYAGGGLNNPSGIGVDSTGSVWVANYFGSASRLSPVGAAVFANGITGAGLNNSYGLAVDLNDNVWIPNEQPFTSAGIGSVTELSSAGSDLSGGGYISGGLDYPLSVAIDPNGTVWVVDFGDSRLTLLNQMGTPLSGTTGYASSQFAFPVAVAVDGNHFGWVANQSSSAVTKVAPDGSSFLNFACCNGASGVAIDVGNNVWVANYFGDSVSLISSTGKLLSSGSFTGGGSIYHPQGIAVDGSGNIWVANYRAKYLTELAGMNSSSAGSSLTPAAGLGADAGLLEAYALAIDASGSIWVSNLGSNTVTKFIGVATPVQTPLSGLPRLP